jgi:hypothetical protein
MWTDIYQMLFVEKTELVYSDLTDKISTPALSQIFLIIWSNLCLLVRLVRIL